MIPYGRQIISEADIRAVTDVLRSDFLTQGPAVPRFEQAVAARVGQALGLGHLDAEIHPQNAPSLRCFEQAGCIPGADIGKRRSYHFPFCEGR